MRLLRKIMQPIVLGKGDDRGYYVIIGGQDRDLVVSSWLLQILQLLYHSSG